MQRARRPYLEVRLRPQSPPQAEREMGAHSITDRRLIRELTDYKARTMTTTLHASNYHGVNLQTVAPRTVPQVQLPEIQR
jgi:hypothetical protein